MVNLNLKKKGSGLKQALKWSKLKYFSLGDFKRIVKSLYFIKRNKKWEAEEYNCFKFINEMRREYAFSNQSINVIDYGAGSPGSVRSIEEMEDGIELEKKVTDIYKVTSSPEKWGKIIFKLIRELKPENCLELGTSLGISAAYQVSALKLNGAGRFTTIEGSPEIAKLANKNLNRIGFENCTVKVGKFKEVLPGILNNDAPFDFVFIDGHHDRVATKEYFEILFPFLAENAIIIFDDINWSNGMKEVWAEIKADTRVNFSIDLNKWGICQKFGGESSNSRKIFLSI